MLGQVVVKVSLIRRLINGEFGIQHVSTPKHIEHVLYDVCFTTVSNLFLKITSVLLHNFIRVVTFLVLTAFH